MTSGRQGHDPYQQQRWVPRRPQHKDSLPTGEGCVGGRASVLVCVCVCVRSQCHVRWYTGRLKCYCWYGNKIVSFTQSESKDNLHTYTTEIHDSSALCELWKPWGWTLRLQSSTCTLHVDNITTYHISRIKPGTLLGHFFSFWDIHTCIIHTCSHFYSWDAHIIYAIKSNILSMRRHYLPLSWQQVFSSTQMLHYSYISRFSLLQNCTFSKQNINT